MIPLKRLLSFVAITGALGTFAAIAADSTPPCDVPVTTSSSSTASANSPEQPPNNVAVMHNGKVICLPQQAADAHVRHGDQPLGACQKPGNQS